jgi:hypothetical protein
LEARAPKWTDWWRAAAAATAVSAGSSAPPARDAVAVQAALRSGCSGTP